MNEDISFSGRSQVFYILEIDIKELAGKKKVLNHEMFGIGRDRQWGLKSKENFY
jgi:hypothetical protein